MAKRKGGLLDVMHSSSESLPSAVESSLVLFTNTNTDTANEMTTTAYRIAIIMVMAVAMRLAFLERAHLQHLVNQYTTNIAATNWINRTSMRRGTL